MLTMISYLPENSVENAICFIFENPDRSHHIELPEGIASTWVFSEDKEEMYQIDSE
jgi:hypothetical protein